MPLLNIISTFSIFLRLAKYRSWRVLLYIFVTDDFHSHFVRINNQFLFRGVGSCSGILPPKRGYRRKELQYLTNQNQWFLERNTLLPPFNEKMWQWQIEWLAHNSLNQKKKLVEQELCRYCSFHANQTTVYAISANLITAKICKYTQINLSAIWVSSLWYGFT